MLLNTNLTLKDNSYPNSQTDTNNVQLLGYRINSPTFEPLLDIKEEIPIILVPITKNTPSVKLNNNNNNNNNNNINENNHGRQHFFLNKPFKINNNLKNLPYELMKTIETNIMRPYSFHANLLTNANIFFNNNQLKYFLFKQKNATYPSDEQYLSKVGNMLARLSDHPNETPFAFCKGYNQISRPKLQPN